MVSSKLASIIALRFLDVVFQGCSVCAQRWTNFDALQPFVTGNMQNSIFACYKYMYVIKGEKTFLDMVGNAAVQFAYWGRG